MPSRPALPYESGHGHTVTRDGDTVIIAGRAYSPVDALDLSAVIARAVAEIGHNRCTRPHHTPEGA